MKEFEAQYPVVGTSALKPNASTSQVQGAIIKFPSSQTNKYHRASPAHAARSDRESVSFRQDLRMGSVRGKAFNRVTPLQATSAGIVLSAAALVTIFFGI